MVDRKINSCAEMLFFLSWKMVFVFLTIVTGLSFAAIGYGESVVSTEAAGSASPAVGEQLQVNVDITKGEDVAGYGMLIIFDATALKYIGAVNGDYLPVTVWMAPLLADDGSYKLELKIGASTSVGETLSFGLDKISVNEVFFNISEDQVNAPNFPLPAENHLLGGNYWGIALLASSAPSVASPGDGTLSTLTFEVLKAEPSIIELFNVNLSDAEDAALAFTLEKDRVTIHGHSGASVDVNGDGSVNILDLVFVAARFGKSLTTADKVADVNNDGVVNILDLVLVAKNFSG